MPSKCSFVLAMLLTSLAFDAARAEAPPLWLVHAGETKEAPGRASVDLPFASERGYGHVGGEADSIARVPVRGGHPDWPTSWREGEHRYSFRVESGVYRIDFAFLETVIASPGARIFDVHVEGRVVLEGVDIAAAVGDFAWLERSVVATVRDGWLDVELVARSDRAPRLSRIAVRSAAEIVAEPGAPHVFGRGGILSNELWWSVPEGEPVGYGVLRAPAVDGPYRSVTSTPVRGSAFVDHDASPGRPYYYIVRAYSLGGAMGPASEPLELRAYSLDDVKLRKLDLSLPPGALDIEVARIDAPPGLGELRFYGQRYPARIGILAGDAWGRRKSVIIDMSGDTFRVFQKRDVLLLDAASGDWTQLQAAVSSRMEASLGLAAPRVEPVVLLSDGRFWGIRHDSERIGADFRRRAGLDREGVLVRPTRLDHWRPDWSAYGARVGDEGDIVALNLLVQELERVEESEVAGFFESRFYLDRLVDRLAAAAVRGQLDAPFESLFLLRDSRNGRWELFRESYAFGDLGVERGSPALRDSWDAADLERVLFPLAQRVGTPRRAEWSTLFTRLFAVPGLRDRYLGRVEACLEGEFAPERFEALVRETFAGIETWMPLDPDLAPFDHGATWREAPARLVASHRSRVAALREFIAAERRKQDEAVRIVEVRVDAAGQSVFLRNEGEETVDLGGYRVSDSLDSEGGLLRSPPPLAPGATLRVSLPSLRDVSSGGVVALWRPNGRLPVILADFAFHGRSSDGVVLRRVDGAWALVTSGDAEPVRAPSFEYVQGVEERSSEEIVVWLRPLGHSRSPESVERVALRWREAGEADWRTLDLPRSETTFRYETTLSSLPGRPRLEYWFQVVGEGGIERAYPLGAPEINYGLGVAPTVVISELCPRPRRDRPEDAEFIEIFNPGEEPVPLQGLYLTDDRRVPNKWRIEDDIRIPPGGYVVFYADGLGEGMHTSFRLSNSGEFIGLYGPIADGNLRIHSTAFRGVPAGYSWGLKQDGTNAFRAWKDPTPGRRNAPKIPEELLRRREDDAGPPPE